MKKTNLVLGFLALSAFAAGSPAADWKGLQGTYALTPEHYLDPPEHEPKDSHLRFQLEGDAARDLYQAMKVAEQTDECTGAALKQVGEMRCLHHAGDKGYRCNFSIDIMRQSIGYGVAC